MTVDDFNFISGLLHCGKMDPNLDCSIKAREIKEERNFSDGAKLVEYIKVDFKTAQLGPRSTTITIPMFANLDKKIVTHYEWGPVEEIKTQLDDAYNSTVIFQHTGNRIVYFEITNTLSIYLCGLKTRH
jgi:hypothetical protein